VDQLADDKSIVVIVLGPAVVAALVAALVMWLRSRRSDGGKAP
jgi:hypothetical protein